jgi:hypothetical protein
MADLLRDEKITEAQCTERYIRSLLIHSFDTARKFIKINEDQSGDRMERLKVSKDKSKRKQRQKDVSITSQIGHYYSRHSTALLQPT